MNGSRSERLCSVPEAHHYYTFGIGCLRDAESSMASTRPLVLKTLPSILRQSASIFTEDEHSVILRMALDNVFCGLDPEVAPPPSDSPPLTDALPDVLLTLMTIVKLPAFVRGTGTLTYTLCTHTCAFWHSAFITLSELLSFSAGSGIATRLCLIFRHGADAQPAPGPDQGDTPRGRPNPGGRIRSPEAA